MAAAPATSPSARVLRYLLAVLAIFIITGVALLAMGREPICTCGTVRLWHGLVQSAENSQHLADWYSPTHIVHGILFWFILWLVARRWPAGLRAIVAIAIEGAWEILENTDWVIDRYRAATISLDYYGDSIVNSLGDIAFMIAGLLLAMRLPWQASLAIALLLEVVLAVAIRDNLTLNVLMLIFPVQPVLDWQAGA